MPCHTVRIASYASPCTSIQPLYALRGILEWHFLILWEEKNEISKNRKEITKQSNEKPQVNQDKQGIPIVGVGASAGGLEAITTLLELLPLNTGLVFVIIQHLATGQESMLTSILGDQQTLVLTVKDEMQVEPNRVYVIPPGKTMTLKEGHLKLIPKGVSLRPIRRVFQLHSSTTENSSYWDCSFRNRHRWNRRA